jgi:hypothetical protein
MSKKQRAPASFLYLLLAAELVIARWESGDLADAVRRLDDAIANVKADVKAHRK